MTHEPKGASCCDGLINLKFNSVSVLMIMYHVLILLETFVEEKDIARTESRLPDKFDYTWIPSKRDNARGRSEGGVMMAVDKKLEVKDIKTFANDWIVKADIRINGHWSKVIGVYNQSGLDGH